jgi:hypothetical protein
MIRPRLRLYVCASAVAVSLGGAVFTQAAGPGEFISRLWNREPAPKKEVTSSFNPFKWIRRDKAEASARRIRVSDHGRHVVSERPSLVSDPFINDQQPVSAPQVVATRQPSTDSSRIIVRPEPRQKPGTNQTVEPNPSNSSRSRFSQADGAARSRFADIAQENSQSRAAIVAQQALPEVQTSGAAQARNAQSAGSGQFVSGFDNEFQKLFKEVIEESRQSKTTATPRLPEDALAGVASAEAARLPEVAIAPTEELRKDFAEFAQERSGADVNNLIQESRSQMESSVLARQAARGRGATNVAAASHSNSNQAAPKLGTTSDSEAGVSGSDNPDSDFNLQRLPDQAPQTVNQLIVPSSMVPERGLFSTSEGWMNRAELERQVAAENVPDPDLQPVIRVVPGSRGAGIVIESGQWSPIQPRVSSNVAPARSVPDTSQFRRLSFEGADASDSTGAVQAIGDSVQHSSEPGTNAPHAGQHSDHSAFMIPVMSDETATAPSALSTTEESGEAMAMIIPDSRTGQSLDAAELGAALADAPAPPQTNQPVFEWPDESEVAVEAPSGGFGWGSTAFFLALTGGAIGLFFRRKAQGGAFVMTGTGTESEIS